MAEKIDLSLDDIIKMNKKTNVGRQGNNKKNAGAKLKNLGARSGIVTKRGGPKNTTINSPKNNNEPTKLLISNLHFNVTNEDVKELFSDIGRLRKAAVHYDKSGRSQGTAEVIFSTRDAAQRAIKKYHNLPLDGRPMSITIVPSQNSNRSPTKSRIGIKAGSGIYKKQIQRNSRGGPPGQSRAQSTRNPGRKPNNQRGGPRQPKKQVTAEELDADLANYKRNN